MNQKELKNQLHDKYLQTYQKIELLCRNLSFFMNNDDYFQVTMQEDALDLLLEAQTHQQPVEYVFGDNLCLSIYERYKECLYYSFSYGNFAIIFITMLYFMDLAFPRLFLYHYIETEYYVFMLFPILAKILYWLNEMILFKIIFRLNNKIIDFVSYFMYLIEILTLICITCLFVIHEHWEIYLLIIILCLYIHIWTLKSKSQNKKHSYIKVISQIARKQALMIMYEIEILILILFFSWISRYIEPLNTTGSFVWFIPLALMIGLSIYPFKGLKRLKYPQDREELLDQYLSHYQFLKTKRERTHDISLTKEQYFIKVQKRHQIYRWLFPFICIGMIFCFIMFMMSFQLSLFYFIMIGYSAYALYHLYSYYHLKDMIKNVCFEQIES